MSTVWLPQSPGRPARLRWSGSEFDRAVGMGLFDKRHVELIDGEILEAPPVNDPRAQAIRLANYALLAIFPPDRATVCVQCPMRLGESRPLPDFSVVTGTPRQISTHPTTALLVMEVSDTTLGYDREDKARLYAAHALPEYWIINLNDRCVEVHREPNGRADNVFEYAQIRVYREGEQVVPLSAGGASINVSDLLPTRRVPPDASAP